MKVSGPGKIPGPVRFIIKNRAQRREQVLCPAEKSNNSLPKEDTKSTD